MRMFLAYIDASGESSLKDRENYVVSSVVISEIRWQIMDNMVRQIKIKHFPSLPVEEIEIHAKDMMNRDGFFKSFNS
jgi:hypothetical protein